MLDERKREIILAMAECNMNESEVSRKLHFHRNNVVYHCEQVREKIGLNPRNFYDLVKLVEMVKEDNNG